MAREADGFIVASISLLFVILWKVKESQAATVHKGTSKRGVRPQRSLPCAHVIPGGCNNVPLARWQDRWKLSVLSLETGSLR